MSDNNLIPLNLVIGDRTYRVRINPNDEEVVRNRFLKAHLESIKNHIKTLSEKNYFSSLEFNTPDFEP